MRPYPAGWGRVEWLRGEMLKTRIAHGYCSRQLAAAACPYANICEQCDNYVTALRFDTPNRPYNRDDPHLRVTCFQAERQ